MPPIRSLAVPPLLVAVALTGCGQQPARPDPLVTDPQALYDAHCARCHARAGQTGGPRLGGSKGPDLAHVGSATGMTPDWLAAYIKEPKSRRPDAKLMPAFADTLTDEQLRILAEWLAAKK